MSKTDYEGNRALDGRYGGGTYAKATTVYLALFTSIPTPSTPGTEVAGGSYARQAVTNNATNFPNAASRAKSNANDITFPAASAPWGSVVGFGWFDALTVGNLLDFAALTSPQTVGTGSQVKFVAGQLNWTET